MHPKLTDDEGPFLDPVEDLPQSADVVRIGMRRDDEVDLVGLVVLGKMPEDGIGGLPEASVHQDDGLPVSRSEEIPIPKHHHFGSLLQLGGSRSQIPCCLTLLVVFSAPKQVSRCLTGVATLGQGPFAPRGPRRSQAAPPRLRRTTTTGYHSAASEIHR